LFQSYEQDEEEQYGGGFNVGSFPKEFGYGPFEGEGDADADGEGPNVNMGGEQKPRILLMGLRR